MFKDLLVTDEKRYTIMKPRKQLIDAAVANGSIDRMNMLLSAAHLLNCEANSLVEEASDLMAENGLLLGDLKKSCTTISLKAQICTFWNSPHS